MKFDRHFSRFFLLFSAAAIFLMSGDLFPTNIAFAAAPDVKAVEDADKIVMENGIVRISLSKARGQITSIKTIAGNEVEWGNGTNAMVYDFDNHNRTHVTFGAGAAVTLVANTPDLTDAQVVYQPTPGCTFRVEMHYLVRRGDSGFYSYVIYHHDKGMAACTIEQTRAVIRPVKGEEVFTNYVIDDNRKGPYPVPPAGAPIFDTTWPYGDGIAHSKYETVAFIGDDLVHGMAGHGRGMWLIQPGRDYVNGGPLRQELTVHQDTPTQAAQNNILLWMLDGNHFGGPIEPIERDQVWTHFYGPMFVYLNEAPATDVPPVPGAQPSWKNPEALAQQPTIDALWADAKKKAADEDAKWPYNFIQNDDYPLDRGVVKGQIKVSTGDSAEGAWVVLTPSGDPDWCMSSSGYIFWTKADAAGNFAIPKVRPGEYSLHVSGANQFEDFRQDGVKVAAGDNALGAIDWKPVSHGKKIWQIGIPDRSSQEFKDGKNIRHFDNFLRYPKNFPDDVTFTIGKSKEDQDWNFAQYALFSKRPYWSVIFDAPAALTGKGTLTLAFAAWQGDPGMVARLNGNEIGSVKLTKSGMSFYRCGGQDSLRQTVYLPFDASLIKSGRNELQLVMTKAVAAADNRGGPNTIPGGMWDALKMEVGE